VVSYVQASRKHLSYLSNSKNFSLGAINSKNRENASEAEGTGGMPALGAESTQKGED